MRVDAVLAKLPEAAALYEKFKNFSGYDAQASCDSDEATYMGLDEAR